MKGKFTCIVSISYIDSEYLSCYGRMCMFFDRHNQKNSSERKLPVILPVHPVLETIIAVAAIAVVRDREPQGLVV